MMKTFADAEYAYHRQCADDDLRPFEDYTIDDAWEAMTWQAWQEYQENLPPTTFVDDPSQDIPF